jgi:hypothetical protein
MKGEGERDGEREGEREREVEVAEERDGKREREREREHKPQRGPGAQEVAGTRDQQPESNKPPARLEGSAPGPEGNTPRLPVTDFGRNFYKIDSGHKVGQAG